MEEKIKAFDKMLEQYEYYNVVINRAVRYILEVIWGIWMMIPIQEFDRVDLISIIIMGAGLSAFATILYLHVYTDVRESVNISSVYKKLAYIPVSALSIFRVRFGYLWRYCRIKLAAGLILQAGIALAVLHTLSFWNVLYPLLIIFISTFLMGLIQIYPWRINIVTMIRQLLDFSW